MCGRRSAAKGEEGRIFSPVWCVREAPRPQPRSTIQKASLLLRGGKRDQLGTTGQAQGGVAPLLSSSQEGCVPPERFVELDFPTVIN